MSDLKSLVQSIPGSKFLPRGWFLVGGAVRDALLGRPVKDWDVVVPGHAERVANGLSVALGRVPAVPLDDGVVRVIAGDAWVDVVARQGKDIMQDLARRDFTINAMAVSPSGKLVDPTGGLGDLGDRIIRALSRENLRADPLRCLRAFRFASELGFSVEPKTFSWIKEETRGLENVAPERIWFELKLLLLGQRLAEALRVSWDAGVLPSILPELLDTDADWGGNNLLHHSMSTAAVSSGVLWNIEITPFVHYKRHLTVLENPSLRAVFILAALLHDIGKPHTYQEESDEVHFYGHDALGAKMARRIARRLRMSGEEADALVLLIANHMHPHFLGQGEGPTRRAMNRFLRRTGEWAFPIVILTYADALSSMLSHQGVVSHLILAKSLHDFIEDMEREKKKEPRLLTGNDLIALGLKPGPLFREILDEIDDLRAEGKIKTKKSALAAVRAFLKEREASSGHRDCSP
ncbi:MAG: CCA tRNA nucleotidyltransferase [candidate division WOR-3 bacterium]